MRGGVRGEGRGRGEWGIQKLDSNTSSPYLVCGVQSSEPPRPACADSAGAACPVRARSSDPQLQH